MSTNNSFLKLMEEEEKLYPHAPPEIEKEITGSVRVMKYMGNIVELYMPRLFDMFLSMMGGNVNEHPERKQQGGSESDSDDSPVGKATDK